MPYHPVIMFASKERARTPLDVLHIKHYIATFPQTYKTEWGATNFARRNKVKEYIDSVWQLAGSKEV
ncbi:MAG: hypothetical protein Q8L68_04535 [Methylococcales bacterium]|nr:hypothetical protein [Methylococcales bacterium]